MKIPNTRIRTLALAACVLVSPSVLPAQNCAENKVKSGSVCTSLGAKCSPVTDNSGSATGACRTQGSAADGQTCECIGKGPAPDFSLSASPASVQAPQAGNGTATISVSGSNGFAGSVTFSASGAPSGVTAILTAVDSTTTQLTLSASPSAALGVSTITIKGTSGALTHTTSVNLTVGPMSNIPAGFVLCANENGTCTLPQPADVAFGSGTTFFVKTNVVSSIACNNATFGGDPTPNIVKACYTTPRYSICSLENQTCSSPAMRDVVFLANGAAHFKLHVSGDIPCNNATFGDPAPGIVKACYSSAAFVQPAWGFADLHTHPASHLGFGSDANGENGIIWGKPGMALSGANLASDLPPCGPDTHSGFTLDPVAHETKKSVLSGIDAMTAWPHSAGGAPGFSGWPDALSLEHQQMHVTAIRRAFDGGLRLMVASATNNQVLSMYWTNGISACSNGVPPPDPNFDLNSAIKQLSFIKQMAAANFAWMQVVATPAEARQAINSNKLAVVLGTELDSLTAPQIQNLAQNYGVRTVIPIHLADSSFGGSAIYGDQFNTNTKYLNGAFFSVVCDPKSSFKLGPPQQVQCTAGSLVQPSTPSPLPPETANYNSCGSQGHRNAKGIVDRAGFQGLMKAALILDVAHMSMAATDDALGLAQPFEYPMMDSHTGIRDDNSSDLNERSILTSHATRLANLGGVLGLGTSGDTPPDDVETWLKAYQQAVNVFGGRGVALGTDMNGLSPQILLNQYAYATTYPFNIESRLNPPASVSPQSLPRFQLGSRVYDFAHDGIANYGMLADFMQAISERPDFQTGAAPACDSNCKACIANQCDAELKVCNGSDGRNKATCAMNYGACLASCRPNVPPPNLTPNPTAIPSLRQLFHSAEDFIEMWEKVELAAKAIQ